MTNTGRLNKRAWLRIAACLLCLLIVAVSLDSLPDPPAVNPHGGVIVLASLPHHHLSAVVKIDILDCVSCASHFQASLIAFGQVFEIKRPVFRLELVQRAIDISPPDLS